MPMGAEAICQMTAVTSMILPQKRPIGSFWESPFAARMQGDCPQRAERADTAGRIARKTFRDAAWPLRAQIVGCCAAHKGLQS